ncbi:hypothetical protein [Deinococcus arenicola]|uniref:DUF4760 domain-containing protein n=1 Tax=Deinococcus arenicola TaxID=2994950 RepID=A0ABU4DLZ5_9DEIO|nr:hypothetical protein [Deinococcus sp. ZS9-10]MDV6373464.1 hypothetical protein [Deinococcus sp. ZS9-10]
MNDTQRKRVVWFVALAFGLWMLWPVVLKLVFPLIFSTKVDMASLGQFGDLYGSINPIITLISIYFIYISLNRESQKDKQEERMLYVSIMEKISSHGKVYSLLIKRKITKNSRVNFGNLSKGLPLTTKTDNHSSYFEDEIFALIGVISTALFLAENNQIRKKIYDDLDPMLVHMWPQLEEIGLVDDIKRMPNFAAFISRVNKLKDEGKFMEIDHSRPALVPPREAEE